VVPRPEEQLDTFEPALHALQAHALVIIQHVRAEERMRRAARATAAIPD
jgi:hypothetical protein